MYIFDLIIERSKVSAGYKAVNILIKQLQNITGYIIDRGVESVAAKSWYSNS